MIDKSKRMSLKPQAYIPLITLCMYLVFWVMTNFAINVSDSSTPAGVYRVRKVTQVKHGDLVVLRMPAKEVLALPGDRVMFTPTGVYINGKLLPNSAPEPGMAQVCRGDHVVPPYMFLGLGLRKADSWDGRYTCFLPQSLIEGTATQLW